MNTIDNDEPPESHASATADHQLLPNPDPDAALRLLTRSPHPYHRRSVQLHGGAPLPRSRSTSVSPAWSSAASSDAEGSRGDRRTPVNGDDDSPRHNAAPTSYPSQATSRSMSESGTEADDEGYGFVVKALPAPPIRPHKGLRDVRGAGAGVDDKTGAGLSDSALLTPSQLDEEGRRLSGKGYFRARGAKGGRRVDSADDGAGEVEDEEVRKERERFARKRRAELLRRSCEVALLGVIGMLVLRGAAAWGNLNAWSRVELSGYVVVYGLLVLLYPLRLLFTLPKDRRAKLSNRIRIPAAFDPAPLLYPAAIPILISLSLYPSMEKILLPNIVLAAAALPPQLIPSFGRGFSYSTEHWFVSIIPLIISEHTDIPSRIRAAKPYLLKAPADPVPPEIIASLFALHQALLPPLYYITTTSLLPAELHLLSVALINLLLFSTSPQMTILSAILWIGGVSLFISCGRVLRWNVALARIPKWRFRHAGRIIRAQQTFLSILNEGLRSGSSRSRSRGLASDSDADEDGLPGHFSDDLRLKPVESAPGPIQTAARASVSGTMFAFEAFRDALLPSKETVASAKGQRGRRHTLPGLDIRKDASRSTVGARKRKKQSYAQSFLSLTSTQAALRKWLYAGYVYVVMALLILAPIRAYIGKFALGGYEPFGWAIGYLLGNLREVRFWIVDWGFNSWVALPPLPELDSAALISQHGRAEYIRQVLVGGAANTRLLITGYWVLILILGMATVLSLSATVEVDTRRKVFHGMMVAMLLPTIFADPCFVALTLALVLCVFCLLDLIRASQLPPLSKPLAYFLTPYVDGRDLRGPVVVSHIFLLIGCAIPLWLSLAGAPRATSTDSPWSGWDVEQGGRDVSMVAGVVCVGMGDAAASLIGRRFGRCKWPWLGGKSLEGSVAFAAAVTAGLVGGKAWLRLGQWDNTTSASLVAAGQDGSLWPSVSELLTLVGPTDVAKAMVSGAAASFMEAVLTGGNDNVIVPVVLWLVVRGVGV